MMSQRRFKYQSDKFLNELESYPQNYLPFISRSLEFISEITCDQLRSY
jgi:hypothetical protein